MNAPCGFCESFETPGLAPRDGTEIEAVFDFGNPTVIGVKWVPARYVFDVGKSPADLGPGWMGVDSIDFYGEPEGWRAA